MNKNFYASVKNVVCVNVCKRIALVFILSIAGIAQAAPGDLDTTFAGTGKMRVAAGGGEDRGNAVARQSDGKLVVAGTSVDDFVSKLSLVRFNANGTLDASFGTGGKIITPIGVGDDIGNAVAVQPDGKILVAGTVYSASGSTTTKDFAVARYVPGGSFDSSYGASRPTKSSSAIMTAMAKPMKLFTVNQSAPGIC